MCKDQAACSFVSGRNLRGTLAAQEAPGPPRGFLERSVRLTIASNRLTNSDTESSISLAAYP